MNMQEKDLEILRKILKGHHFVDNYIDILINHVVSHLETTSLGQITPHFLYSALAFELGRNTAKSISEDFEDYKKTGEYKSKLQRFLDRSPFMK
jgi:hypothetical protein